MNDFMVFMKDNWGWIVSFVTILSGILIYVYRHIRYSRSTTRCTSPAPGSDGG